MVKGDVVNNPIPTPAQSGSGSKGTSQAFIGRPLGAADSIIGWVSNAIFQLTVNRISQNFTDLTERQPRLILHALKNILHPP